MMVESCIGAEKSLRNNRAKKSRAGPRTLEYGGGGA